MCDIKSNSASDANFTISDANIDSPSVFPQSTSTSDKLIQSYSTLVVNKVFIHLLLDHQNNLIGQNFNLFNLIGQNCSEL